MKPSSERLPATFVEETLRAGFEVSGFEGPPGVVINIRFPDAELDAVRTGICLFPDVVAVAFEFDIESEIPSFSVAVPDSTGIAFSSGGSRNSNSGD